MRKPAQRSKTFGRLSASGETAIHAGMLDSDANVGRATFLRSSVILILTLSLSCAFYWAAYVRISNSELTPKIATLPADEFFGFGSAVIAACRSTEPITWDRLSRSVSAEDDGTVSEGIARGFAAFAELQTQIGEEAACSAAIDAITAREPAR